MNNTRSRKINYEGDHSSKNKSVESVVAEDIDKDVKGSRKDCMATNGKYDKVLQEYKMIEE